MTIRSPFRWFVCLGLLTLLTSTVGIASASATGGTLDETDRGLALIALSDTSTTAGTLDETDRALALIETTATSSTAGTLDETDRALALIETSGAAAASGDPSWPPTANARSIQLTESRNAPGGMLAGIPAPPVRVAYEDSEHAVAQNRFGGEVAAEQTNRGQPY